ncbi:substrate-binding domain-containing protein [Aerococcaceae bacterium WGS1372]
MDLSYSTPSVKSALNNQLKIPKDIAIIGFDNIDLSNRLSFLLSIVNQPRLNIGYQSFELLHEEIR